MAQEQTMRAFRLLSQRRSEVVAAWTHIVSSRATSDGGSGARVKSLQSDGLEFFDAMLHFLELADYDLGTPHFSALASVAANLSAKHARAGLSPRDTATFLLSFKEAIIPLLIETYVDDYAGVGRDVAGISRLIDRLSLETFAAFLAARESIIAQQSRSILDLSTPALQIWSQVILMPIVGIVDTERAQQVMEDLLNAIVRERALVAILDVSGVPIIDTRVALHLTKTIRAAQMLGAQVVLTGIRPEAAQTLVKLDVDFSGVRTRGTLRAGLAEALGLVGARVSAP